MRPVREAAARIRAALEDVTPMAPEPEGPPWPSTTRYRISGLRDVVREIDAADLETVLRGYA